MSTAGGAPVEYTRNRAGSTASNDSTSSGVHSRTGSTAAGKGSFFHSVKKAFSTSKHSDVDTVAYEVPGTPTNPELQGFSHGFTGLQTDTNKLKHYVTQYHTHINGLLESGKAISDVLDRLLHSTDPEHVQLATNLRLKHTLLYNTIVSHSTVDAKELNDDTTYQQHTNALKSTLTTTEIELDQQVEYHNSIAARVSQRNNLASEVEYYSKKFHGLQEERTKRAAAGKVEKPADAEKFDRNQRKLTDVRQEYLDASAAITEELRALLNARGQVYGRALLNISNSERELGNTLAHINKATEEMEVPAAVPAQPPSLLSQVPMHTNSNVAPVNGEIPAINQATATAVTSGATRATDGSELLAKNQAVLPPTNASEYNVAHPYDSNGQLRDNIQNQPRKGVDNESVYNATPEQLGETRAVGGVKTFTVLPTQQKSSNDRSSESESNYDGPATTSYNTGNAINESHYTARVDAPTVHCVDDNSSSSHQQSGAQTAASIGTATGLETAHQQDSKQTGLTYDTADLQQQVMQSLQQQNVPMGNMQSSDIGITMKPSTEKTVIRDATPADLSAASSSHHATSSTSHSHQSETPAETLRSIEDDTTTNSHPVTTGEAYTSGTSHTESAKAADISAPVHDGEEQNMSTKAELVIGETSSTTEEPQQHQGMLKKALSSILG